MKGGCGVPRPPFTVCGEDEWSRGGEAVGGTVGDARGRRSLVAQHGGADAALVTDAHGGDEAGFTQLEEVRSTTFQGSIVLR